MQISEFKGIEQYHDGRPVSDYCNMIPLVTSVIDRHGERFVEHADGESPRPPYNPKTDNNIIETFVDSLGNIYIATRSGVVRTSLTLDYKFTGCKTLLDRGDGYNPDPENDYFVTFVESSTKPSQVYCCDGHRVWYWNTQTPDVTADQVEPGYEDFYRAFVPHMLPFFDVTNEWLEDYYLWHAPYEESGRQLGWCRVDDERFNGLSLRNIYSITWFDNRLVLVEKDKNTVWLSEVDPSRWLTPAYKVGNYLLPEWHWQSQDSETPTKAIDTFCPNYYASTASSANIQDVVAFAGQLYFLNDTSIEVWSATGNGGNPIQHNSQNTLYYGGRSPIIVNDTLYLICKGAIQNDFIAAIGQTGNIQKISNDEVERHLQTAYRIRPLAVRDQSMIVVYTDGRYANGYAFTKAGLWWRYWNGTNECLVWSVIAHNGRQFGVSQRGLLVEATEQNRKYAGGGAIRREITGGFMQFVGRRILREMEIVCDTGVYLDTDLERFKYYLRVSFDRGLNYGPFMYRKAGASGKNNRVILWRNCGSGNSILLQFGTADNMRFQIFGLRFELT